ncbi:ATP-binding cassette domain-containing protein [bacterium]|nr:ATP-binding cassette domain-containing protein [candidate division CSSED10-310 bacterium]
MALTHEDITKSKGITNPLTVFLHIIRPYWISLGLISFFSILTTSLYIPIPYFTKILIDTALPNSDFQMAVIVILLSGLFATFGTIMNTLNNAYASLTVIDLNNGLQLALSRSLFKRKYNFFKHLQTGEILSRFGDLNEAVFSVKNTIDQVFRNCMYIILLPPILFIMNWRLALLGLIGLPLEMLLSNIFRRKLEHVSESAKQLEAVLSAKRNEMVSKIEEILLLNSEAKSLSEILKSTLATKTAQIKILLINSYYTVSTQLSRHAFKILFGLYGWYAIIVAQTLTLGSFLAFTMYLAYLKAPLEQSVHLLQQYGQTKVAIQRFLQYFLLSASPDFDDDSSIIFNGHQHIKISNGTFAYDACTPIFSDLSITFKPGSCTIIKGSSGSGKSTLIKCIVKWLDLTEGALFWGNMPYEKISWKTLRNSIGYMSQTPVIFNTTIADNIRLANDFLTEDMIIDAAKKAQIHADIMKMPMGYKTILEENGQNISYGQRQRICLARTLAHSPPVMLFDEPTSGVGKDCAARIVAELTKMKSNHIYVIASNHEIFNGICDAIIDMDALTINTIQKGTVT